MRETTVPTSSSQPIKEAPLPVMPTQVEMGFFNPGKILSHGGPLRLFFSVVRNVVLI